MSKLTGVTAVFCFIVAVWATAESALAQQVGSAEQGLRLARAVCAECHLVDKVAGRSANSDAPTFATIADTQGMTAAALTAILQTPHRTMPNVIIKGGDMNDIVAYILSLKDKD
jgi:mono/diheme cytochrome c family protein